MKTRSNIGGNIIKRVIVYEGMFHCLVQDYCGKVHHAKFDSYKTAMRYMTRFQSDSIKLEYLR